MSILFLLVFSLSFPHYRHTTHHQLRTQKIQNYIKPDHIYNTSNKENRYRKRLSKFVYRDILYDEELITRIYDTIDNP